MRRLKRSCLLSTVIALGVVVPFAGASVASAATPELKWAQASEIQAPENAMGSGNFELNGVACPAGGSCVAVGDYVAESTATAAAVVSQTGAGWGQASEVKPPAPAETAVLSSVACTGVGACVAVGYYSYTLGGLFLPMVVTETAGKWGPAEAVKLPSNSASGAPHEDGLLSSVGCSPSGSCIAAGSYVEKEHDYFDGMVVAKIGGTWEASEISPPAGADGDPRDAINSVSCPAAGACVAVGSYVEGSGVFGRQAMVLGEVAEGWGIPAEIASPEGAAANPEASMRSVACAAVGSCVAVGQYEQSEHGAQAMLAHSSAGVWSATGQIVPPENVTSGHTGILDAVACPTSGPCAAVGSYPSTNPAGPALATSGSGGEWSRASEVLAPSNAASGEGGATLTSVACPVSGNCIAVGFYQSGSRPRQAMVTVGTAVYAVNEKSSEGSKEGQTGGAKKEATIVVPTSPGGVSSRAQVTLTTTNLPVQANGQTTIKLSCVGPATCSGKLTLTVKRTTGKGKHRHAKNEPAGSATFSIPGGGSATVELKLSSHGRALLHGTHGRLGATLEILESSPGPAITQHDAVHLVLGAKSKKR